MEQEWLNKIKSGDSSCYRFIIEQYKDEALALAYTIVKDFDEAEDVVQEAFIKAYTNIKKFKENSTFSTWFYRIVVNTALSSLKKSNKTVSLEVGFEDIPSNTNENEFCSLEFKEQKECIDKALKLMKPVEALLLKLYYLDERNINEIKEITGFKSSKIKVSLFRARKTFYEKINSLIGQEAEVLI